MATVKSTILNELPSEITKDLNPTHNEIKDFLEENVNKNYANEINDVYKKTLVLEAQKSRRKKKSRKPRPSKKQLTAREKRDLGLYRLPKTGLLYTSFTSLNSLWEDYMKQLLDTSALKEAGWEPPSNLENTKLHSLQVKICKADLHGAIIKVEKADCPTHVGRQGICLMETRHTLQLISPDNKLRLMPKKGSVFSIQVDGYRFIFPGSSMISRPAERVKKTHKSKPPLDF